MGRLHANQHACTLLPSYQRMGQHKANHSRYVISLTHKCWSQLRRWEVIKTLGEVPGPWKMSSFAYGYTHREPLLSSSSPWFSMALVVCLRAHVIQ